MQGDVSTRDLVSGSIILAAFLSLVFIAGKVLYRFKTARFRRTWQPLIPVISGTIVDDGGGAATSWLTGTFQSRAVRVSMTPGRNRHSGESGERYNYFEVSLLNVPGVSDWAVGADASSRQPPECPNPEIPYLLRQLGHALLSFDARCQTLTLVQEPGLHCVPSPQHFQRQLTTLLRIAAVLADNTP